MCGKQCSRCWWQVCWSTHEGSSSWWWEHLAKHRHCIKRLPKHSNIGNAWSHTRLWSLHPMTFQKSVPQIQECYTSWLPRVQNLVVTNNWICHQKCGGYVFKCVYKQSSSLFFIQSFFIVIFPIHQWNSLSLFRFSVFDRKKLKIKGGRLILKKIKNNNI